MLTNGFEIGLTAGVIDQQGILTPSRHLTPLLVYTEVRVYPVLGFVFPTDFMRLIMLLYCTWWLSIVQIPNCYKFTLIRQFCFHLRHQHGKIKLWEFIQFCCSCMNFFIILPKTRDLLYLGTLVELNMLLNWLMSIGMALYREAP
jgi:hypothetical protein